MKDARPIAWRLECPLCRASPGSPCVGKRGERKSVHRERYSKEAQMEHGERVDEFIKRAAQSAAVRYEEECYHFCGRCESPIEALLVAALFVAAKMGPEHLEFELSDKIETPIPFDEAAFVYTQIDIGKYRADILILDASLPLDLREPRLMIVECDGHEYHERTKEQAARDKKRDRYFQSKGYKVLRFTGSEIWADPEGCASEIIENLACNDHFRMRER
jgi:very-short-patch-repair endonuclease